MLFFNDYSVQRSLALHIGYVVLMDYRLIRPHPRLLPHSPPYFLRPKNLYPTILYGLLTTASLIYSVYLYYHTIFCTPAFQRIAFDYCFILRTGLHQICHGSAHAIPIVVSSNGCVTRRQSSLYATVW